MLAALPTIRMDDQAYDRRPMPVIEGEANTTTSTWYVNGRCLTAYVSPLTPVVIINGLLRALLHRSVNSHTTLASSLLRGTNR